MKDVEIDGCMQIRCRFDVKVGDNVVYDAEDENYYELGVITSLRERPYRAKGHVISVITSDIEKHRELLLMIEKKNSILKDLDSSLRSYARTVELCRLVAEDEPKIAGLLKELDALGKEE